MSQDSDLKQKALNYLKAGANQEETAKALGVEPSTISYYLTSDPDFATEVQTADLIRRQKHNKTDELADEIEHDLLERLQTAAAGLYRPMELAKVYSVINAAKRRGTSAPSGITNNNQQVISINLPQTMLNRIRMNSQSQVVSTGGQDLITIQSGNMKGLMDRVQDVATSGVIQESHHAHETNHDSHHLPAIVSAPQRPSHDRITATTINGLTSAEQAARRVNAGEVKVKDISTADLGFD